MKTEAGLNANNNSCPCREQNTKCTAANSAATRNLARNYLVLCEKYLVTAEFSRPLYTVHIRPSIISARQRFSIMNFQTRPPAFPRDL